MKIPPLYLNINWMKTSICVRWHFPAMLAWQGFTSAPLCWFWKPYILLVLHTATWSRNRGGIERIWRHYCYWMSLQKGQHKDSFPAQQIYNIFGDDLIYFLGRHWLLLLSPSQNGFSLISFFPHEPTTLSLPFFSGILANGIRCFLFGCHVLRRMWC